MVSLCGSILIQPAYAQWFWWESWTWCEHKSHLSWGFAGNSHLGRKCAREGGTRARNRYEPGFSFCSVAITALSGMGSGFMLLEQKSCRSTLNWFCSLLVWARPTPMIGTLVPEGSSAGAVRPERAFVVRRSVVWLQTQVGLFLICYLCKNQ